MGAKMAPKIEQMVPNGVRGNLVAVNFRDHRMHRAFWYHFGRHFGRHLASFWLPFGSLWPPLNINFNDF